MLGEGRRALSDASRAEQRRPVSPAVAVAVGSDGNRQQRVVEETEREQR